MQNSRCRSEKRDPDLLHCKTSSVGAVLPGTTSELFYCSIDDADCRYALPVGYDYLCKHDNSRSFAATGDF